MPDPPAASGLNTTVTAAKAASAPDTTSETGFAKVSLGAVSDKPHPHQMSA